MQGSYLGIGRFNSKYSLVYQLKQAKVIHKSILGVFIGSSEKEKSELNFGDPEASNIVGDDLSNLYYFKTQGNDFWKIRVDHIKIGNFTDNIGGNATLMIEN